MASELAKVATARWMNRAGLFQSITAAIDEALAEWEKIVAARERWECHQAALTLCDPISGYGDRSDVEASFLCEGARDVAGAIAARGPMLSPGEEP